MSKAAVGAIRLILGREVAACWQVKISPLCKRQRFSASIIAHAIWLHFRFPLSLRLIKELLFGRGIIVAHEIIRCPARKFGPDYASRMRRKAPSASDVWHLDEVVAIIGGEKHQL